MPSSILIVDDDRDIRETLSDLLSDEGYAVQAASNGAEALQLLRGGFIPALVLLDLMMPVMNGYQFLAARKGDPALAQVPVVVVTAGRVDSTPEGANAWLPKPLLLNTLLAEVERFAGPA